MIFIKIQIVFTKSNTIFLKAKKKGVKNMIFETNISDYYKVVQSSDECCYKYILGKLQEAKEIYIMAFGKSQRNIQLMDSLKSLKVKI